MNVALQVCQEYWEQSEFWLSEVVLLPQPAGFTGRLASPDPGFAAQSLPERPTPPLFLLKACPRGRTSQYRTA